MILPRVLALVVSLAAATTGCQDTPGGATSTATAPATKRRLELVAATPPVTDLPALVKAELARATGDGKQLLVYVGASWCEPCTRFHAAAAAGELDATFGTLRLLELDADRDGDALTAAGYTYELIPLFVVPGPDGRATDRKIEGSIKGEGAVAQITPRLQALLAASPTR